MAFPAFDDYLTVLGKCLRTGRGRRSEIACELSDHLQQRLAELTASGMSQDEAARAALDEFGDAAALASEFTQLAHDLRRRWIMRCTVGSLCAALVAVMMTLSFWPEQPQAFMERAVAADAGKPKMQPGKLVMPPTAVALPAEDVLNSETRDKLARPISVEMVDTPLVDVLDFVRELIAVQMHPKWKQLEANGVERKTPVTLNLKNVPAEMVLNLVFDQCESRPELVVQKGIVIISSEDDLNGKTSIQVYNVRDLLHLPATPVAATASAAAATAPAVAAANNERLPSGTQASQDGLITTITNTVVPSSWDAVGGQGSIASFNGLLVVNQTATVHANIEKLLRMLREAEKQPSAVVRDK